MIRIQLRETVYTCDAAVQRIYVIIYITVKTPDDASTSFLTNAKQTTELGVGSSIGNAWLASFLLRVACGDGYREYSDDSHIDASEAIASTADNWQSRLHLTPTFSVDVGVGLKSLCL